MQLSRIFRAVRRMMKRGEGEKYICNNIYFCLAGVPRKDRDRAREVIMKRIHPYDTVGGWAWRHNLPDVGRATDKDFREFRIRWLRALEAEFKAKGD